MNKLSKVYLDLIFRVLLIRQRTGVLISP